MKICALIGCSLLALKESHWCGTHGVRFLGDPGMLEPARSHEGLPVGDYRKEAKPELLNTDGSFLA